MRFDILTIFPDLFSPYFGESIMKRAVQKKKVSFYMHDLRAFTTDKHRSVDDRPYGGGPGMVMKVGPVYRALQAINLLVKRYPKRKRRVLLMSAKGTPFTQKKAQQLSKLDQIVLICPRYEGIDERITQYIDEEVSVGPYVLTGGELPALTVIDSVVRLIPGVLGEDESSIDESHSEIGILEYPQYTRPEVFKGKRVPKELLSGHHKDIAAWRKKMKKKLS